MWFDESIARWYKATYANRFGLAWGREGSATAAEYLTRLRLQNQYFGDDIRLVSLVNSEGRLRIVTSQPHVVGEAASLAEIQTWFEELCFSRLEVGGRIAWYHRLENLLIADAHEGNVIKSTLGPLVPIDLNIIRPSGELLDWARSITD